jgi:hypothetical protein
MSESFDPYEYVGVIAPGSVALFGAMYLYPDVKSLFGGTEVNVGGLGLFLIASLVVGHLVQGVGNALEGAWWRLRGGMPTDWLIKPKQSLLNDTQKARVLELCRDKMNLDTEQLTGRVWYPAVREIYAIVEAAGRSKRIDAFNRTYGLLRGISAGCMVFAALVLATHPERKELWIGGLAVAAIAFYRMDRFARRYAREVFLAYLSLNAKQ